MDAPYWNRLATAYDHEVVDSLASDKRGVIAKRLSQYADRSRVACDFGCGVGKYVPELARRFRRVYGIDFAAKLLAVARETHSGLRNVRFMRGDLRTGRFRMRRAHLGVCTNVLISPRVDRCVATLRNIRRHLVRRGHLMVLVPSTESALYVNQRHLEWNRREGLRGARAIRDVELPASDLALIEGIFSRDGVATKHYLREEIAMNLELADFEPLSVDKVEYDWTTEFESPPKWLGEPWPWDWLLVARRKS